MKLGISLAIDWIRGVLIDDGEVCYRTQVLTPIDCQQSVDTVLHMIFSIQRTYGNIDFVGISIMQSNVSRWGPLDRITNFFEMAIDKKTGIHCQSFGPALVVLQNLDTSLLSGLKGNIMSIVVDFGCELCVVDKYNDDSVFDHAINVSWAHLPLKNYQPLVDGISPVCECCGIGCVHQFISTSGIERQYFQFSLQRKSALEIIQGVDGSDAWAQKVYRMWMDQLARALLDPIMVFKPRLLVLSGLATIHSDFPLSLKSVLSRHCPNNYLPEIIRLNYEEYRFAYDAAMANKEKAQYTSTLAL
ncbi:MULTISPECIES: ROK family protein [Enterobacteriaceae]|uniref:ROK family protein n=1 Tax=Klebsiella michiganensis TaxID=1134687 RepID=UPI0011E43097|nr:ROK family protein [Klebsiella michiganensis]TYD88680.1 hypothetical protein DJ519_08135 [Klebsiella michiganensis]